MANNYQWASFAIPVKDANVARERMVAIEAWLGARGGVADEDATSVFTPPWFKPEVVASVVKRLADSREDGCSFSWEIAGLMLDLYHNESIDVWQAVKVAMIMLDLDEAEDVCTMEWADVCDKPRTNQFGGGAVAFNRRTSVWKNTSDMALELRMEPR